MKILLVFFCSTEYSYDLRNNLTSITNDIGGQAFTQLYGYGAISVAGSAENAKDNLPTRYAVLGTNTDYYYNSLNQLTKREVGISSNPITNTYTYNTVTINNTLYYTNQLAREDIENDKYYYSYDDVGNITLIRKSTNAGSATNYRAYTYDNLNRLKTETLNGSTVNSWEYDDLGNITSKTTTAGSTKTGIDYVYGTSSSCGWENLLTSVKFVVYNGDGSKTVTKQDNIYYDAIGNPYSYRGAIMGWYGRQMTSYTKNGVEHKFTYDADGLRSTKTVNGSKTEYQYVGDKLFYEKRGDGNSFYYFYDSYGKLSAIYHYVNGTRVPYHVVTNAQGDVVALYNWSGTKVAEYSYDAWGNCTIVSDSTSTGIATLNPFRYRSYYYDTDLSLYYLQSRYYDSEIGRFINADSQIAGIGGAVQGYNMYSYCMNNPVNLSDDAGNWPRWATIALGAVATVVAVAVTVVTLGAAAPAAACTLTAVGMSIGASYAVASTAATVAVVATTVAAAAYAGDIAYSAVTGDSLLLDTVFQGNTDAYNTGLAITSIATAGMLEAAAQSPGVCFVAGTPVLAACGYIAIEEIKVGDMVRAEDPATGKKELKEVVQTFVNETTELIYVQVGSEEIVTTPEHPFFSPVKGWIAACELRAGDILVLQNGKYVTVEKVQHEILEEPITVYNFEVADFHTYYVGKSAVLVHNTCGGKPTSPNQMQKQVERGQAPSTVVRVDNPKIPGQLPHIHFSDGTAINIDGSVHDAMRGAHTLTNSERIWILDNGWGG